MHYFLYVERKKNRSMFSLYKITKCMPTQDSCTTKKKKEMRKNNLYFKSITDTHYKNQLSGDLLLKYNIQNVLEMPCIKKIILNTSSKKFYTDKKNFIPSAAAFHMISGRNCKIIAAKKSIAGWKLRKDQPIACRTTLRKHLMYAFLDQFSNLLLVRFWNQEQNEKKYLDFDGNFTIGLDNFLVFPECENYFEFFECLQGMNITIVASTKNKKKGVVFFSGFQCPVK